MDNQQYTNEEGWKSDRQQRKAERRQCRDARRNEHKGTSTFNKGLIFLLIGLFLFLRTLDLELPNWVFSWQLLLIVIGIIVWAASQFKNWGGLIMILVGTVFFAKDYLMLSYDLTRFIWPAVFTIVGLALIFGKRQEATMKDKTIMPPSTSSEDAIDSTVIFSGQNRVVVSKDFKGGTVTAIFGGADYNLIQADFQDKIELDVTCIFGGVEIILPANWDVRLEMGTIIMGGVTDKRPVELLSNAGNSEKIFVLKGTCIFGGIEIRNYL
jgi:predicted membrane protein